MLPLQGSVTVTVVTVTAFCYRYRMDTQLSPPKCFICEQKHWASEECPKEAPIVSVVPKKKKEPEGKRPSQEDGCLSCGATAETFADAERWRNLREKRKQYMRKKRAK